ncbi:MAG: NAD(P)-dependent oxidoreductase [Clostridia bacterium]|nr:NAD(P)-dependent oxidoreductase [Clostridia bacterium]
MALRITNEASRCLQCKKPMCREGCPAHTPIPEVIALFKENRLMEAGRVLFENNPMSLVCSMVCDHMAQCAGHCVLGRKGQPVHFYEIENYISDAYLDRMSLDGVKPYNGKNAAVIGSGPAGMTAAFVLAWNGYGVTIFEEKDRIGGMMQYGIPDFRLPKTILDRYKARLLELGVKIRPHVVMGGDLMIDNLFRDGYKSVFIGTGVWRPSTLGIEGETLPNVHFGISYLARPISYTIGQTVAVIGMGNVAMDVARTAFRHGARRVMLFQRGSKSPASDHEMEYARLDGTEFIFGKSIQRITPEGPVFKNSVLNDQGRPVGVTGEDELVRADTTIIAINQRPKDKLVNTTTGLNANERGLLIVDENNMTTRPGVFAAGDVVHGSLTVVHAVDNAKKAAAGMMRYMENNGEDLSDLRAGRP